MSTRQQIIDTYVERVSELEDKRSDLLTQDEFDEIKNDLDISHDDLEFIDESVKEHTSRGEKFILHSLYDDAIEELRMASALAPFDHDVSYNLAKAYCKRYEKEDKPEDLERMEKLARRCIELDPDSDAYWMIEKAKLSKQKELEKQDKKNKAKKRYTHFFPLTALVILATCLPISMLTGWTEALTLMAAFPLFTFISLLMVDIEPIAALAIFFGGLAAAFLFFGWAPMSIMAVGSFLFWLIMKNFY